MNECDNSDEHEMKIIILISHELNNIHKNIIINIYGNDLKTKRMPFAALLVTSLDFTPAVPPNSKRERNTNNVCIRNSYATCEKVHGELVLDSCAHRSQQTIELALTVLSGAVQCIRRRFALNKILYRSIGQGNWRTNEMRSCIVANVAVVVPHFNRNRKKCIIFGVVKLPLDLW